MANFKYAETITTSRELLDTIKSQVIGASYPFNATAGETAVTNTWALESEVVDVATGKIKELVLKGTSKINALTREFYVKFTNSGFGASAKHSSMVVQVLFNKTGTGGSATFGEAGQPVNIEWAKQDASPATDRTHDKPVYLYMNVMNNRLAMVIVGDPAVNFDDYRKSFVYIGALKPFKYNEDDVDGNIMVTGGSVTNEPSTVPGAPYNFGAYTSYGNNTLQMFKTRSGIKFQQHFASFITQAPGPGKAFVDTQIGDTGLKLEPQGFNASSWTKKYHLSPIYIVHPFDGYRGSLDYCIAVSKNNILHLDELIVDIPENTEGKAWKQEVYRYFDHNTENHFMKKSANVQMGIAFLKEVRY
ncbi:hypothetical protein [Paenibacillus sp. P46E]|uniref:hypothetical protein n=1 Tax=Paenibacillus sp. P46E TaxID=1349436 RepID=UPI00093C887D|nr:hypothetical protein [Paenibacillus sp. P46E]OKP97880.1 hypothetical protein A3849_13290 [Paenibacillus sp. P46E]